MVNLSGSGEAASSRRSCLIIGRQTFVDWFFVRWVDMLLSHAGTHGFQHGGEVTQPFDLSSLEFVFL
jgi:hypothetical protein